MRKSVEKEGEKEEEEEAERAGRETRTSDEEE